MTVATSTAITSKATDDSRDIDIDIDIVDVVVIRRLDDRDWDLVRVSLFWKIHIIRTMNDSLESGYVGRYVASSIQNWKQTVGWSSINFGGIVV
mmetsp:Transcript_35585/g.42488  ORF Transcript_35585/g.42488 Transcript_35585/m.42488 type:complete len:94 (-) Transcript_35585:287-568(-)